MSWKENKACKYSPVGDAAGRILYADEDEISLAKKRQDDQEEAPALIVRHSHAETPPLPAGVVVLPAVHRGLPPQVLPPSLTVTAAPKPATVISLPKVPLEPGTLIGSCSTNSSTSDATAMPPPPPPPAVARPLSAGPHPPTSLSPPAGVSSTSAMDDLYNTDRSDIEFDGNDQVLCRVCGDKASGFHYGVHSCEGCKGFFRRSIQQKIQYRPCTKNQQCNILRINRNRCQYCRLKKCIAAGMSRDAVRFGRVPKREKAKILAAMQSSRMKTQESRVLSEMQDEGKIIETVVRAHYDTCDYTRNKIEPFAAKARAGQAYAACTGQTCPMKGRPQDSFLDHHFSERFMDHVRQVCNFAKLVPGFKCLHHDDQVTLLKSCVFEVLLVRLSGLFDNQGLICLNGDMIRKSTIDAMPAGNARFLMDSVFDLAQRLNQFGLSDAEIGLFCSVVIITADRPGLRNPDLVQKMQDKLKGVLRSILLPQHPEHDSIFAELMTMVHDLRTLNTLHTEKFLQQCKVSGAQVDSAAADGACAPAPGLAYPAVYGEKPQELERQGSQGNASPHSSDSTEDNSVSSRRSPIGSVSSSESSVCGTEVSRLTAQDLRVNNSVLMNALTIPAIAAAAAAAAAAKKEDKPSLAHRLKAARKLDSPSDSGIDSPKESAAAAGANGAAATHGHHSTNTSVCSSPRSATAEEKEEKMEMETAGAAKPSSSSATPTKREEQHPLLKRALQQPPQVLNAASPSTVASFKDEVYKPHKKFRRLALAGSGDDNSPTSSTAERQGTPSPASSCPVETSKSLLISQLSEPPLHLRAPSAPLPPTSSVAAATLASSLLASTLSRATPLAHEETKRNEILANLILNNPAATSSVSWASRQAAAGLLMCAAGPAKSPAPVESKMSQLAAVAAAAATLEAETTSQPLNLSKRSVFGGSVPDVAAAASTARGSETAPASPAPSGRASVPSKM